MLKKISLISRLLDLFLHPVQVLFLRRRRIQPNTKYLTESCSGVRVTPYGLLFTKSNMASHESAKKSIRKSTRQRAVNASRMNRIRTFIKKLEQAIADKVSKENVLKAFSEMQKEIMKGVNKKVVHKNAAARKISRMCHKVKVATGEDKK